MTKFLGATIETLLLAFICASTAFAQDPIQQNDPGFMSKKSTQASSTTTAEVAVIKTNKGEMVVEFWPDVAPKTVENFKKLANEKFYDGTCFHRIVKGFMIQGGDPLTKDEAQKDMWGTGGPGYQVKAEFNDRKHVRGVLSMARSRHPDSAGSQFFICLDDASFLDGQYTAFGKLIKGEDVLMAIGNTPTQYGNGGEKSQPLERIEVQSVRVTAAETYAKPAGK